MAPVITSILDLDFTAEAIDRETGAVQYTSFGKIQSDDGIYCGKIEKPTKDISFEEFTEALTKIPDEDIYPKFPTDGSIRVFSGPDKLPRHLYLKGPRLFGYQVYNKNGVVHDISAHLIQEASVLETLCQIPHPNIIQYHGCRVERGLITGLVLDKKQCDVKHYIDTKAGPAIDEEAFTSALTSAVERLHSLGLAHNDINQENILLTEDQMPVLISFDFCRPFGEKLEFFRHAEGWIDEGDSWVTTSKTDRDFLYIEAIREYLQEARERWSEGDAVTDTQDV